MMSYTGTDVRPSLAAALSSNDLVQRDTFVIQDCSTLQSDCAILLDEVLEKNVVVVSIVYPKIVSFVEVLF